MSLDELRSDPYAWAFVRRHHQTRPRILRIRRIRKAAIASIALLAIAALSVVTASFIAAGPAPALTITDGGGSLIITIRPDAGPEQIMSEVRAVLDDRKADVRVETLRGRHAIVGRVIGDGHGVVMVDSDPAFDFTATSVVVSADATGIVSLVIAGPAELDLGSAELVCGAFGRPVAAVRAELEANGLRVQVTPVALDETLRGGPHAVADLTLIGSVASIIAQPVAELAPTSPFCG